MVSLVDLEGTQTKEAVQGAKVASEVDSMDTYTSESGDLEEASSSSSHEDAAIRLKRLQQQQKQSHVNREASNDSLIGCEQETGGGGGKPSSGINAELMMEEEMDEEQLKRILACKRLSEGCNRFAGANLICRKNSLHIMGESLAPVTEGEPMRHLSHHMSQNIESTSSSSVSSGSFRAGRHLGAHMAKRNSQDDNTTSCSSSTSLDGPRSPTRRRSSTVSQCSSVLSEGTRQQLNFDLSPDLPADSSILEANTISPTEFERPASPEPSSLGSADEASFDMRPISRMSQYYDESMLTDSPDSTLGDSHDHSIPECAPAPAPAATPPTQERQSQRLLASGNQAAAEDSEIGDNLERIITHVSTVKVSAVTNSSADGQSEPTSQMVSNKRAHTPFGANLQRVKASLISNSPSPTAAIGNTLARL